MLGSYEQGNEIIALEFLIETRLFYILISVTIVIMQEYLAQVFHVEFQ
jgi:hypothetical protein